MRKITAVSFMFMAFLVVENLKGSFQSRILAVYPLQSKSHFTVDIAVVKELANRGHDVTVVSGFPEEKPLSNYKEIILKKYTYEDLFNHTTDPGSKYNPFETVNFKYFQMISTLWSFGDKICNYMLPQEPVQNLIKSNEKFDLVFIEAFYIDCFIGFAHKFKAPVIQIATFSGTEEMGDLVGNPTPYAYIPDVFQEYQQNMSFKERLINTLGYLLQKLVRKYFIRQQDEIMRKYFNDPDMPSIEELHKSTSLLLINHHFSISYPRPVVPNFIEVGGMHIKPPKKLPADLQKYLDEAKDGVIYFSMGSRWNSAQMPNRTVQAFTNAFSKLKHKVLWKWEDDSFPGQPANLRLEKWLPQSDILAHPNLKLFITHGGLLSTQETIHRGVPVVGIPILGDQWMNMARTEAMGVGKILRFKNITEESILWTITEVLENPSYRENAQRMSRIFRDQPLTPLEQAVYWTEYVIRHKGAPHMRSAALDLTWYQYFLLDVIAVLVISMCLLTFVLFLTFRAIFRMCCRGSKCKTNISDKNKKN